MNLYGLIILTSSNIFLLICEQVGNAIGGRKEPGVYWRDVMKDEPMPKAIQGLLPEDQSSSLLSKKPNCQTIPEARNGGDIVKGFEPKKEKVFWVYDD